MKKRRGKPEAHCKNVTTKTGSKRKMCWDAKGKITSPAKVAAARARRKAA